MVPADVVGKSELKANAVGTAELDDVVRAKLAEVDTNAGNITELERTTAATRTSLADLEGEFPDPIIPDHAREAKQYVLEVPATSGRATWEEAAGGGTTDQTARDSAATNAGNITTNTAAIATNTSAIDALERDFLIEPNYWVRDTSGRTFVVHVHSGSVPNTATRIQLTVSGVTLTNTIGLNRTNYFFGINPTNAGTIARNIGADQSTIDVNLNFLDASGTVLGLQRILLRVVASAPSPDPVAPRVVAITDQAALAINASTTDIATVTITANRTLNVPSGGVDGQIVQLKVKQDTTGSRTLTLTNRIDRGALDAPELTTTASKVDYLIFQRSGTVWVYQGILKGYNQ